MIFTAAVFSFFCVCCFTPLKGEGIERERERERESTAAFEIVEWGILKCEENYFLFTK